MTKQLGRICLFALIGIAAECGGAGLVVAVARAADVDTVGRLSNADFERANSLRERIANTVFGGDVKLHWLPANSRFWYRVQTGARQHEFVLVDMNAGSRALAFDHKKLADALISAGEKNVDAGRLDLQQLEFGEDGKHARFTFRKKAWQFELPAGSLQLTAKEPIKSQQGSPLPSDAKQVKSPSQARRGISPDGKWRVVVKDFNLWIVDTSNSVETQLSHDGKPGDEYTGQFAWSPDSRKLVGVRVEAGAQRQVTLVESSPKDQLQPKVIAYNYLKPGDKLPHPRPQLFDVQSQREVPVRDSLFPNPFTESGDLPIRWERDSKRFTFSYNQRGHQVFRVIAVSAESGAVQAVVIEECKTFFCYSSKQYQRWLDDTRELIWMSERDGWNHLWLYDAATGCVKNQITCGAWAVRKVDRVDEKTRQIWFRAGGVRAGQDPYYIHYCRINFDGTGLVVLTEGDGTHSIEWSPDRKFFVDSWSRVDLPPVSELRRADGTLVCELNRADWCPLLATGWRAPERFVAKGRDGTTDIYGVIYRPTNFDANKKYPVIEHIYAGPHSAYVPKAFNAIPGGWVREMAELGFIVVQCDGMGTSYRSKVFHDVCWKNLGDSGFADRIAWLRAAAARYPQLDLTRVGIYGGSAGGQSSTRAMLAHGDFYKVAVSDCGCHDNRLDKIWWNEQWMGWPIGPHYAEQSNVTQARHLSGKLMLVVGELDKNVDPASTLQVAHALVTANKDFDLLLIPGAGHGAAETPYGNRRRAQFLVRHLLSSEPQSLN